MDIIRVTVTYTTTAVSADIALGEALRLIEDEAGATVESIDALTVVEGP